MKQPPPSLLEIAENTEPYYHPLVDYGVWRVAVLNDHPDFHPEHLSKMERHFLTDEVFILFSGKAHLLAASDLDGKPGELFSISLEPGIVYNVKKGAWHWILTGRETQVFIVENQDTSQENSEYGALPAGIRDQITFLLSEE